MSLFNADVREISKVGWKADPKQADPRLLHAPFWPEQAIGAAHPHHAARAVLPAAARPRLTRFEKSTTPLLFHRHLLRSWLIVPGEIQERVRNGGLLFGRLLLCIRCCGLL